MIENEEVKCRVICILFLFVLLIFCVQDDRYYTFLGLRASEPRERKREAERVCERQREREREITRFPLTAESRCKGKPRKGYSVERRENHRRVSRIAAKNGWTSARCVRCSIRARIAAQSGVKVPLWCVPSRILALFNFAPGHFLCFVRFNLNRVSGAGIYERFSK